MNRILIIGKGSHAEVVKSAISNNRDDWKSLEFVSVDESDEFPTDIKEAFIAIGDNSARERLSKLPYNFSNIIQGRGIWCIGMKGCFFGHNSFVGNNSKVGNFCIVNTGAILEHNCELGDYSHLASGAVTGGNVKIGKRTLIGTGAVIRNGITIGDDVVVGAGAVVVDNIPDGQVWFGVPARHQWGNQK